MRGIWKGGKLYMSFENEQYEYIHEAYGSVELYAIYKILIFFVYTMPLPDTLIVYISMPTGFFIWGYMYPFTFIFRGTSKFLGVQCTL